MPPENMIRCLRASYSSQTDGLSDVELLRRCAANNDDGAFELLVRRHAEMVWRVCRAVAGGHHAAEDAFQATFLALVRKSHSTRETVAGWLYRVAFNAARKIRLRKDDSGRGMKPAEDGPACLNPEEDVCRTEAAGILHDELTRLNSTYRLPLILHYFDGCSHAEIARTLGWPVGTVATRINRGRDRLHQRLTRRGVILPSTGLAAALTSGSTSAVPPQLTMLTVQSVRSGHVSPIVRELAAGVRSAMSPTNKLLAFAAAVVVVSVGTVVTWGGTGEPPAAAPEGTTAAAPPDEKTAPAERVDRHGDPLPPGAVARMGTVRQRAPGAQVAVTPDGKQIVTVDQTLVVRRFDAATGSLQGTHTLPSTPAYGIHLSASGKRLAALQWVAGGQNGTYRLDIWDLERAVRIQDLKTPEGFNQFEGIAFSPDEGQLGFTVNKQTVEEVRIWNLGDGKIRTLFRREEREASHYSDSIVRFSPDGKSVVARLQDRKLRCWEVSTDRLLWEGTNGYSSIFFFSPDSRHLIKYDGERVDAATGQDAPWPHKQPDWKQRDVALGMTPTGTHLVFRTHSSGLLFWDVATGTIAQQIRHPAERPDGPITTIQDLPHNFAFMPDGSGVAWRPGPVERWNVQTGKPVFAQTRADGHTEAVSRVLFSPDGRTLASLAGFNEGRVCVWDVTTSRPLQEFPTSISSHLAYGNNGHVFVLADGGARSH